ncbi:MAG: hypothetical protein ABI644_01945 [Arenimonas sp.]
MNRFHYALALSVAAFSSQGFASDLKLASWNLGWHLSQAEAKTWIAGCDARYELNGTSKTWQRSKNANATTGWQMDWRPRDAAIQLPWTIEKMPPCSVYEGDDRKVIPVTQVLFKNRAQQIAKIIADISPDVMAFQEVSGEAAIKDVLGKAASQYKVCSFKGYSVQRLAFAWKKTLSKANGVCEINDALSLPENGTERRPRPGLRLALDINGKKTAFLNVHLKSSCVSPLEMNEQKRGQLESDQKDCVVLQQQIMPLENWIEESSKSFDRFIVMGDFNRDLWHELDKAKTVSVRMDSSDPTTTRDTKVRVRLLLPEVNDGLPAQSQMNLVAANCSVSEAANSLCEKAHLVRLSRDEMKALVSDMGCRNPIELDQMLVSNNWNAGDAVSHAIKLSIAPYGDSSAAGLAASDHCPTQISLPNP